MAPVRSGEYLEVLRVRFIGEGQERVLARGVRAREGLKCQ